MKRRRLLTSITVLLALSYVVVSNWLATKSHVRWLLHSSGYKATVLSTSESDDSTLKHTEWDGWGWAGQNTTVYLVFDPSDSLKRAAGVEHPKAATGIPCDVWRVGRLEENWYYVVFYTDTDWEHCTY